MISNRTKTNAAGTRKRSAKAANSAPTEIVAPSHDQIARLAEKYWAERGRPEGSPDQDWLRAEQELRGKAS